MSKVTQNLVKPKVNYDTFCSNEFIRIIIKNVTILPLEVHCEVDSPWGDSYDMTTFELGIWL